MVRTVIAVLAAALAAAVVALLLAPSITHARDHPDCGHPDRPCLVLSGHTR